MSVVLLSSTIDPASQNIKEQLLTKTTWNQTTFFDQQPIYQHTKYKDLYLITITTRKIFRENIDDELKKHLNITPTTIIFLSKHTSKMKKPTLTVHPVGNYGSAEFGGKPNTLVPCAPYIMTQLLRNIKKFHNQSTLHFDVCYEVTHHGPYLQTPTLFVEVGSSETEWNMEEPADIIASALLELIQTYLYEKVISTDETTLIGVGGGHYAPRFTDIIFEKQVAFGHMIPAYHINAGIINEDIFQQTIQNTPNVSGVYIHRKALKKPQVRYFKQLAESFDLLVISTKTLPDL